MTSDPDQIRRQIEGTRRELSADVNLLTEKVSPGRAVGRRVERARGTVTNLKDKIMGSAYDATSSVGDTASSATERVSSATSNAAGSVAGAVEEAPRAMRRQTQGNPLAAGLIAFGAGWLVASLLPATRKEQELATQAKDVIADRLQPVAQQVQQAATEVKDNLREPAQHAVESVKSTTSDAASTVADEGRAATEQVTDRAQEAKRNVQHQTTR